MDPKSAARAHAEEIRQQIIARVGVENYSALAHYTCLLRSCGVRQPVVRQLVLKPSDIV